MEQFSILIQENWEIMERGKGQYKDELEKNIPKFQRGKKTQCFSKQLEKDGWGKPWETPRMIYKNYTDFEHETRMNKEK